MKLSKTLTCSMAAAAFAASATLAPVANAEVEVGASVGISNMYLWRGYDLGFGSAVVSGDIGVSVAGFHGTVWGSSGDDFAGTEYDLIVGYGGSVGDFSYDLSVVSYVYPEGELAGIDTDLGDFVEAILTLGFGPVSMSYYDNIESKPGTYALGEDYSYFTISADIGDFSVLVGRHDPDGLDDNPTHLDLTYHYNDNLSFTVSKLVADEDTAFNTSDKDAHFVVSYSLPIE
ncbi:MAG: TorF family putative porin [Cellvibrionaceae bacterium]